MHLPRAVCVSSVFRFSRASHDPSYLHFLNQFGNKPPALCLAYGVLGHDKDGWQNLARHPILAAVNLHRFKAGPSVCPLPLCLDPE
jgi:hypothetical protein